MVVCYITIERPVCLSTHMCIYTMYHIEICISGMPSAIYVISYKANNITSCQKKKYEKSSKLKVRKHDWHRNTNESSNHRQW